jgi:ribosomal protein S18 acetylase RimI-like enzyme
MMMMRPSSGRKDFDNEKPQYLSARFLLRPATPADVPGIAALETASYPADEAASPEGIAYRQARAGEFFKVYTLKDESDSPIVVGFVCGTLTQDNELTDESMEGHDPKGCNLCIHSVVVAPQFRRKGLARAMLVDYARAIRAECPGVVKKLLLIAKAYLLKLYVSAGFQLVGLSSVVHGQDPWFEMKQDLILVAPPSSPPPSIGSPDGLPFVQVINLETFERDCFGCRSFDY